VCATSVAPGAGMHVTRALVGQVNPGVGCIPFDERFVGRVGGCYEVASGQSTTARARFDGLAGQDDSLVGGLIVGRRFRGRLHALSTATPRLAKSERERRRSGVAFAGLTFTHGPPPGRIQEVTNEPALFPDGSLIDVVPVFDHVEHVNEELEAFRRRSVVTRRVTWILGDRGQIGSGTPFNLDHRIVGALLHLRVDQTATHARPA